MEKINICPFCKCEVHPLDRHCAAIKADSPNDKSVQEVSCILTRYYQVEVKELK